MFGAARTLFALLVGDADGITPLFAHHHLREIVFSGIPAEQAA
ncbi:hypothetical protein ACWENR_02405 [Micromonospora sp. NPDC004336]